LLWFGLWTLWATRGVVHKSTATGGFAQAIAAMRDDAERDRSIVSGKVSGGVLDQTDRLASECLVDVDRVAQPLDLAVGAHPPHGVVGPVVRRPQNTVEASRRACVMLGRGVIAESLMRALVVVKTLEDAQPFDLFAQANEMVAAERKARAKLEERVVILERRDGEKRVRLERLEKALRRIERVKGVLGET